MLYSQLALKIAPLYLNIVLGYIAGKKLDVNRDTITKITFYMINPLIIFNGVLHTPIHWNTLSLPLLTFVLSSLICIVFYRFSRKIWTDSSKNIMAYSAGSGNTGYFGIPMAIWLIPQSEGTYVMSFVGMILYENTLGYYISAKGIYSAKQCLFKLFRLPSLYAFVGAILLNVLKCPIPSFYYDFINHIKGMYVVMGMMIIGLALSSLKNFKLDFKFVGMTFLAKFLVWPVCILGIITLDVHYLGLYDTQIHQALMLLSIVPLAVSTVIIASLFEVQPEKAAATVLLSTLFALVYVPLMASLFL
jgi:predicted permease